MTRRFRPTILDVARGAGVSATTVSYVLSGTTERADRISDATRGRVLGVAADIGYVPNESARSLRLRRTNRVLFLGSRFTSLFSQTIAQSIEPMLLRHGLSLATQVGAGPDHIRRAIGSLDQHQADGLIVETEDDSLPELREAASRGHAIVAIGPSLPDPALDVVSHDVAPAIRQAMDHLLDRGYQRFVLMSRSPTDPREHRIETARSSLLDAGVPESEIIVAYCRHDRILAHEAALALLPRIDRPVAVYAGADISAIGVLWAAARRGFRIPDDVGVVGHGNTSETQITVPRLTSLGPLSHDFSSAVELMVTRLKEPGRPGRHITEPCQLTIREST